MKRLVLKRWQFNLAFLFEGSRRSKKLFATWQFALAKKCRHLYDHFTRNHQGALGTPSPKHSLKMPVKISPRQNIWINSSNDGIISNSNVFCHKYKVEIMKSKLRDINVLLNTILYIILTNQFTYSLKIFIICRHKGGKKSSSLYPSTFQLGCL